jgi:crossover junction endodeoxyribonuclease RusA
MRVFLPYPPSVNKLWKPIARGKLVRTPAYRSWMNDAVWVVFLAVRDQGPVRGEYALNVWLHPKSVRRLRDIENFLKAPSDALVKGGAIEDDSLCQDLRVRWGSFDDPGVLLDIEPCPSQTSHADGNARSPSGNEPKSPRPTRPAAPALRLSRMRRVGDLRIRTVRAVGPQDARLLPHLPRASVR